MVPKLRFKEFCGEWEEKRLGDVCKIYDGTHQTPKYVEEGIKFLSVENIKNIYKSNKYITEDAFKKEFKNNRIFNNDILMTRIGDIGTPAIVKTNESFAYYVSLALLKCNEKINPFFLTQFIQGHSFQSELWKRTLHIAFPKKINKGEIGECKISIPSLPEQTKIAHFLSTVDDKIQNQQDKITHLENIKKGFMQKIFSRKIRFKDDGGEEFSEWEEKKIKDVFKITRGYVLSANNVEKNINKEYIYPVYSSQTKDKGLLGYYNEYLYEDAITWTTDGANAGTVHFRRGKFYCTNVCGVLISENGYANKCIAEMINRISKKYVSYVGNPKLMNNIMAEIKIDLPCLKEQQKISDILSLLDEKIDTDKETLEHLKQLKKGLLQQMFA